MRYLAWNAHQVAWFAYRRFTTDAYLYFAFGNQDILVGLVGKVVPLLAGWVAEDSKAEAFALPVSFDSREVHRHAANSLVKYNSQARITVNEFINFGVVPTIAPVGNNLPRPVQPLFCHRFHRQTIVRPRPGIRYAPQRSLCTSSAPRLV